MSTPYHFTPRVPAPPHSTPLSASAYSFSKPKTSRAPIQNPYDKFTQPEFDVWIGGITGALRRALGQEDEEEHHSTSQQNERLGGHANGNLPHYGRLEIEGDDDQVPDDTFAEVQTRRVSGKGKARDPREGPGLGNGDRIQPIEIVSSDEEEEDEVRELTVGLESGLEDEVVEAGDVDGEGEDDGVQYSEEEYSWEEGESSSQPRSSPIKIGPPRKAIPKEEEYYDEEEGHDEEYDQEEDYAEEYDEEEREQPVAKAGPSHMEEQIIELVSDDEEDQGSAQEPLYDDDEEDGEREEYAEYSEGDKENDYGLAQPDESHQSFATIRRPRYHSAEEEDDEEEGYADEEYDEEQEDHDDEDNIAVDDGIEEVQPFENDTSFPPHRASSLPPHQLQPEIHDPWSGPRTFAEDFYSGGEIHLPHGSHVDLNHLSSLDGTPLIGTPANDVYDYQNFNGREDDATMYEGKQSNEENEIQPLEDDTSFPPHTVEPAGPVDIPDEWEGPETFAQDFYSEGDVRTLPGIPIDPSLLSGTADEDSGIDSFLTPGGLTPNESDERSSLEADQGDAEFQPPATGQDSTSTTSEQDQPVPVDVEVIAVDDSADKGDTEFQPPATEQDSTSAPSKRDQPIPADAEIIAVDDSDDEQGKNVPEAAHLAVQEDFDELEYEDNHMETQGTRYSDIYDYEDGAFEVVPPGEDAADDQQVVEGSLHSPSWYSQQLPEAIQDAVTDNLSPSGVEFTHLPTQQDDALEVSLLGGAHTIASVSEVQDASSPPPEPAELEEAPAAMAPLSGAVEATQSSVEEPDSTPIVATAAQVEEDDFDDMYATPVPEAISTALEADPKAEENADDIQITDAPKEEDMDPKRSSLEVMGSLPELELSVPEMGASESEIDDHDGERQYASSSEEVAPPPVASSSTSQIPASIQHIIHPQDFGQLPTPPSEGSRYVPLPELSETEPSNNAQLEVPAVVVEEVSDDEGLITQPISSELEEGTDEFDEDAEADVDVDVEILSAISSESGWYGQKDEDEELDYTVEEPLTEGRLTAEPADRAMSLGVVSVDAMEMAEYAISQLTTISQTRSSSPAYDEIEAVAKHSEPGNVELTEERAEEPLAASQLTAEPPKSSPVVGHEVPMPVTANADVVDPTERPTASPRSRQPNFIISLPGTPNFVLSPVNTPRPAGETIPVSVSVPPSVLRALRQQSQQPPSPGPSHLLPQAFIQTDGLFTPAEPAATITPAVPVEDPHKPAVDRLAQFFLGHISEPDSDSHTVAAAGEQPLPDVPYPPTVDPLSERAAGPANEDDLAQIPGFDALDDMRLSSAPPSSLPRRTPSVFMGVSLTRKPTDPVLMADPYPYSLSTPGTALEANQDEISEEDIGLDNSMSSNSTLEKEMDEKDAFTLLDDGEDLVLQYPSDTEARPTPPVADVGPSDSEKMTTLGSVLDASSSRADEASPAFEEIMKADDPFKLMGTDSSIAPGPVEDDEPVSEKHSSEDIAADEPIHSTPSLDAPTPIEIAASEGAPSIHDGSSQTSTVAPTSESAAGSSSKRAPKRKRDASFDFEKKSETGKGKGKKGSKGKGKAKELPIATPEPPTEETIHVRPRQSNPREAPLKSTGNGVSSGGTTSHMLKGSSRASSVASSARSDQSLVTQPSPTTNKPFSHIVPRPPPPPHQPSSLFHAHGQKRKAQYNQTYGQPKTVVQQKKTLRTLVPRTPSVPHVRVVPRDTDETAPVSPPPPPPPVTPAIEATPPSPPEAAPATVSPSLPVIPSTPADNLQTSLPAKSVVEPAPSEPSEPSKTAVPSQLIGPSGPSQAAPPKPNASESVASPAPSHPPRSSSTRPSVPSQTPIRQHVVSHPVANPPSTTRSTRSQCRYHRISVPKEEGGPRLCFLVPGCCLNDRELLQEEEIEDHGDATQEDSLHMIKDIDALDFDEYLIGVLRMLVGLDILREQEVFYLPQPGIEIGRKPVVLPPHHPRKSISERHPLHKAHGDSGSHAGSPSYSGSARSPASASTRPPVSNADSTSTSRSVLRRLVDSEKASTIADTESESEYEESDDEEPDAKRSRPSPPVDQVESGIMGPPTRGKGKAKAKPRKSKAKDITYRPNGEAEEENSSDETSKRKRRKSTKRGVKRTRTAEAGNAEGGEPKSKKLKMHATATGALSPVKDAIVSAPS